MNQWQLLEYLKDNDEFFTSNQLSEILGIKKDLLNKKLASLHRYGFLERDTIIKEKVKYCKTFIYRAREV